MVTSGMCSTSAARGRRRWQPARARAGCRHGHRKRPQPLRAIERVLEDLAVCLARLDAIDGGCFSELGLYITKGSPHRGEQWSVTKPPLSAPFSARSMTSTEQQPSALRSKLRMALALAAVSASERVPTEAEAAVLAELLCWPTSGARAPARALLHQISSLISVTRAGSSVWHIRPLAKLSSRRASSSPIVHSRRSRRHSRRTASNCSALGAAAAPWAAPSRPSARHSNITPERRRTVRRSASTARRKWHAGN